MNYNWLSGVGLFAAIVAGLYMTREVISVDDFARIGPRLAGARSER